MPKPPPITGELVVAADPAIRIRGTCDYIGATNSIRSASCDPDGGGLDIEWGDGFKNFPEAGISVTQDGYLLYEDECGRTYTANELAILLPSGVLVPLKAERQRPTFLGDIEWAKRLIAAAEAALTAVPEGGLHSNLLAAIDEAVSAAWGIQVPGTTRNDSTHRFEVRSKVSKGNVGWFPVERYGREAARAHAVALLTHMGEGYELVERGRREVDPEEFWRCREGGYSVAQAVWPQAGEGEPDRTWFGRDPDGEVIGAGFNSEREAWEACDRNRMFGGGGAPLDA